MERKLPIRQNQDNPIYGGLVDTMDNAVGIVLNKLKDLGLDKITIAIFTSDNGGVASGDNFSTSNLPYNGRKDYQWEGCTKTLYLIHVPWLNVHEKEVGSPVTVADFYPSILEYSNTVGMSLKSIIETVTIPNERSLYWHYPLYGNQGGDPSSIIRQGDWKLIHYSVDGTNELYYMTDDAYEQHNVDTEFPELTTKFHQKLQNWVLSVNAKYPVKDDQFTNEKRKEYDAKITNNCYRN